MKIKALIVDLDGTILNTITTITHFVNKTFQKYGISPISEQECKQFIGDGARKLIERALCSRGIEAVVEPSACGTKNYYAKTKNTALEGTKRHNAKSDNADLEGTKRHNAKSENADIKGMKKRGKGAENADLKNAGARCISAEEMKRILDDYNLAYDSDPYYLTEKYEGLDALFAELSERKIKLAVLSNKPHSTARAAAEHFYPHIFDVSLGGRDGIPLKPDPAAARDALDILGVSASEVAYLGDSNVDMIFGRAIGAGYVLGAGWGFRGREELETAGADEVFDTPEELRAFLEKVI